jgi:hypothetical protein
MFCTPFLGRAPHLYSPRLITVQTLRQEDLYKLPGVAETLDWVSALVALDQEELTESVVDETLGVLLKYRDDIQKIQGETVRQILEGVKREQAL